MNELQTFVLLSQLPEMSTLWQSARFEEENQRLTIMRALVNNVDELFVWPQPLKIDVAKRLHRRKQTAAAPEPRKCELFSIYHYFVFQAVRFCANQMTRLEANTSASQTLESQLVSMMNAIIDNTKLSLDEKKRHIAAFEQSYPDYYQHHFGHIKW